MKHTIRLVGNGEDRVKYWKKIYDLHGENDLKRQYRWHTYKKN